MAATKVDSHKVDERLAAFETLCRDSGIRSTHQRAEIFRELAATDEHPDAERVYERVRRRIPSISLDTVYRTLRLLEDKGLIAKVCTPGDRFRFDANTDHHHHFICTQCGRVQDFYSEELDGLRPPRDIVDAATIDNVQVQIRGVCRKCRKG